MSMNDGTEKYRDWSTARASRIDSGAIGSGRTKETHVRSDGTYIVEKSASGEVLSVRKIS
jgi:hypothetical protein